MNTIPFLYPKAQSPHIRYQPHQFSTFTTAIETLLKAGADIEAKDKEGRTASDHAKNNEDIHKTEIYQKRNDLQQEQHLPQHGSTNITLAHCKVPDSPYHRGGYNLGQIHNRLGPRHEFLIKTSSMTGNLIPSVAASGSRGGEGYFCFKWHEGWTAFRKWRLDAVFVREKN